VVAFQIFNANFDNIYFIAIAFQKLNAKFDKIQGIAIASQKLIVSITFYSKFKPAIK
jgi:purine-cytosine permease-like protein